MDKEFAYFYEKLGFGPATHTATPSRDVIESFRGRLPDQWLKYWGEYGWSCYGGGLLWTINPLEYEDVVKAWLSGTPYERGDSFEAVARTAFGKLYSWSARSGQSLQVNSIHGMIFPHDQTEAIQKGRSDILVRWFFVAMTKKSLDQLDDRDHPLFDKALKRVGALGPGEMYGFVPALVAGGRLSLEHVQKVDAVTHLLMLAQLGERRIMRDIVKDARNAGLLGQEKK